MNHEPRIVLEAIGKQLDCNIFPLIKNGGVVVPSAQLNTPKFMLEESFNHEQQRKRRPATESRKRNTRRERETSRSWETCNSTSIVSSDIRQKYESELDVLREAYPNAKVWQQPEGLWLLTSSTLLEGNFKSAVFLTCLPYKPESIPKSWGFWNGFNWIGERHTNYPDGSICAFEPKDGTWKTGDSIVKLIDMYTLWALRHLHLSEYKKWPGYQAVHFAHERILEVRDDEFCGCNNFNKKYKDCCKHSDQKSNHLASHLKLLSRSDYAKRQPPKEILKFIFEGGKPPSIRKITD